MGKYKLHHCDDDVVHMYRYTGEGCTGGWYGVNFKNGECGDQMKLTCQGEESEDGDNALDKVENFFDEEWKTIAIAGGMDLLIALVLIVIMLCCMKRRRNQNNQEEN